MDLIFASVTGAEDWAHAHRCVGTSRNKLSAVGNVPRPTTAFENVYRLSHQKSQRTIYKRFNFHVKSTGASSRRLI